ncbi:MAG TPA: sugar phosphate isomerase/epimerase family protein [Tepidisphaeraceae bacterium]|nr:sugar phosphate isomerase/epimerase family protein [Tepidisphaeraceae bacterium]
MSVATALTIQGSSAADQPASTGQPDRKFQICLSPGMISVRANIQDSIALASELGFEAVEPQIGGLAPMSPEAMASLRDELKARNLVWGATGMSMPLGGSDDSFKAWLPKLDGMAAALQRAGASRLGTWITPGDNRLTYLQQFHRLARRTADIAKVCDDHGIRFGLEYLGPKTMRSRYRFQFIHTSREMLELIAETGAKNVGLIVDSWHWYNAGETPDDIRKLTNDQIVWVHLNDAPAGIPLDQQIDNHRALPASTGVINVSGFLSALIAIGYDGPVSAEPFDDSLGRMPKEQAAKLTIDAIHKALAEVHG